MTTKLSTHNSSNVIQLTAPCAHCLGKSRIIEATLIGFDVTGFQAVPCRNCNGSGHVIRDVLLELQARKRFKKRKALVLHWLRRGPA